MAGDDQSLPGTYITVRDAGLISVGGVSTGNIGIVGTALHGEPHTVFSLSGLTDARERFAPTARRTDPKADTGTLFKALELLFANGASTVYAVRAAGEGVDDYKKALELLALDDLTATWPSAARSRARKGREPAKCQCVSWCGCDPGAGGG